MKNFPSWEKKKLGYTVSRLPHPIAKLLVLSKSPHYRARGTKTRLVAIK